MAIQTRRVFAADVPPNDAGVEYSFDDVSLDVTVVRWWNNSAFKFYFELHRWADGVLVKSGVVIPAGQQPGPGEFAPGTQAIPAGQVKMVSQIDPVDHVQGFLPPFTVYCRWPA